MAEIVKQAGWMAFEAAKFGFHRYAAGDASMAGRHALGWG